MIVGFRVTVTNQDLFKKYAQLTALQKTIKKTSGADKLKLLNAQKSFLSKELENRFARLNSAVNVESKQGRVAPPDFSISDAASQKFYEKIFGSSVIRGRAYSDYLLKIDNENRGTKYAMSPEARKTLEESQSTVNLEAKVSYGDRTGIDIGTLSVFGERSSLSSYYDIGKESIVNANDASILAHIRQQVSNFSGTLSPSIEGSKKLTNFQSIRNQDDIKRARDEISRQFVILIEAGRIQNNPTLKKRAEEIRVEFLALYKKGLAGKVEAVNNIIDRLNSLSGQVESADSMQKASERITRQNKVFDLVTSIPELKAQFYQKSKLLQITWLDEQSGSVEIAVIHFPLSSFKSPPFGARIDGDSIKVFLTSAFETALMKELTKPPPLINVDERLEQFQKELERLADPSSKLTGKEVYLPGGVTISIPHSNSIPVAKGRLKSKKRNTIPKIKKVAPIPGETKAAAMERVSQLNQSGRMNSFISSTLLTYSVIQWLVARMPHGPIGGPPKSKHMLTYRTGRFANSLKLLADYRQSLITYHYNPIYFVHEKTGRDPRKLITQGIRAVLKQFFVRRFTILKG